MVPLSACSNRPLHSQKPIPPAKYSTIEGFGRDEDVLEAREKAWDNAIERARKLGYDRFNVKLISHTVSEDDGVYVVVTIEVYPDKTTYRAPSPPPPAY
jgi:hypothetical protein